MLIPVIKPRKFLLAVVALLIAPAVIWMIAERNRSVQPTQPLSQTSSTPLTSPEATPVATIGATHRSTTPLPEAHQIPHSPIGAAQRASSASDAMPRGSYQGMNDPRWPIYWEKREQDRDFEWKTPIEFHGKVLDQDGNPVAGAAADIIWTDMSPSGSSHMQVTSDGAGLFSVNNISGKHMTVRVTKDGYLRQTSNGRSAFEFAGFWEPTYYEPDPNNPVIFYLRKKREPAPLLSSKGKFVLTFGIPSPIPMPTTTAAVSPIKITVFESDAKPRNWRAHISVDNGGIVPALEQFPFEAPKKAISLHSI
jgi:Carboxypeptidase regulatory-like domain